MGKRCRTWAEDVARDLDQIAVLGDRQKLAYALAAYESDEPFGGDAPLCTQLVEVLDWIAQRSTENIINEREGMIAALEEAGRRMWASGLAEKWYEGVDPMLRAAAGQVNGHLLEQLLRATGYHDWRCAHLFREGVFVYCESV